MKTIETGFPGLLIIEPQVFGDARGYFYESYNSLKLREAGITCEFVQDNQSFSRYGVIRGLHFQKPPYTQTKLIRALQGCIYDVVLDLRQGSPTYGRWYGLELSAENKRQFYIPKGFAHGFSVLSEEATILYKCDDYYHPEAEGGILHSDAALGIDWKVNVAQAVISEKDKQLPTLLMAENFFTFES